MVTLKLKKSPDAGLPSSNNGPGGPRRSPVRGNAAARQRPTLAQAQAERAQREEAFRERGESGQGQGHGQFGTPRPDARQGPRQAPRDDRRGPPGGPQGAHRDGPSGPRRDDRRDGPPRHEPRFDPRQQDTRPGARDDRRGPPPGPRGDDRRPYEPRGAGGPASQPWRDDRGPRGPRVDDRRAGPAPDERRWPDRGPGPGYGRDTPAPQGRRDERGERPDAGRPPRPGFERGPAHGGHRPEQPFIRPSERLKARAAAVAPQATAPTDPGAPEHRADGERLSKRMTALGLASRREADTWIEAGWVRVDGKMAVLGQRVGPDARIEIDPAAHQQQAQRVTILLNKPIGYVSGQAEDGHEPAVVLLRPENQWAEDKSGMRWHPGHLRGLAPAGRLDIDSVGLLVLTQDGRVARQLIGEDSTIEKEYLVRVVKEGGGQLSDEGLALLNHGLELDGHKLKPAKVSWANEDQLRFVLREGRKRQIRRMCELVGLTVVGLKRVRIGSVVLGHLPPGQWRYLRREEFFG